MKTIEKLGVFTTILSFTYKKKLIGGIGKTQFWFTLTLNLDNK